MKLTCQFRRFLARTFRPVFEQSPKNSFKRLYIVRGCCFWSKKLRFRKNFDANFNAVERVRNCAGISNNSVPRDAKVSAIDVRKK